MARKAQKRRASKVRAKQQNEEPQFRQLTRKRRERILRIAKRKGYITNAAAKQATNFRQSYYHLRELARAGYLRHIGYNRWQATRKVAAMQL